MDTRTQFIDDDRERGTFRVNRSSMVSERVWENEQRLIFDRCWLYLGHESEVPEPGDFRRRTIGGRPVIFIRGSDGDVRALLNACTHRGATICRQDAGNARTFQCFYHAWTFDTRGELVQVPDRDSYPEDFDLAERALRAPARFESYRGFCFINYDPSAPPLEEYLAGAREYLDLIADQSAIGMRLLPGSNRYAIKANWKLLVENSIDSYHGVPVHSTYFDYLSSYGDVSHEPGRQVVHDLGNGHAVTEQDSVLGRPIAHWHPLFGEEAKGEIAEIERTLYERVGEERGFRMAHTIRNLLIFPNLIVVDGAAITVRFIEPLAPDLMEISAWSLAPGEETDDQLARRISSYQTFFGPGGFATPDDVEALESCQTGFKTWRELEWSDISRGMKRIPDASDELQMRTFWRTWAARMDGREPPERVTDIEVESAALSN